MEYPLLQGLNNPTGEPMNGKSIHGLKEFKDEELKALCAELRGCMIETISRTGGHLASNLGTVELTVALHRIFDSPNDKLVFDVGHQCYAHKLLTGRLGGFETLRQTDGISGFPKPSESEHDSFITGHASTSISAAYGMAQAFKLKGLSNYAVAIIGDGAFTGGEAYEALNNAGRTKTRLVVILNHNDMSISKNVGAFARYLSHIRSGVGYLRLKRVVDSVLRHTPLIGEPIRRWLENSKSMLKAILYRSTFFEMMGYKYFGPVDGHDLPRLLRVLESAKEADCPVVVQVETRKGKGYAFAEENPGAYHAIGGFDILNGGDDVTSVNCYSNLVGDVLTELAAADTRICAITAAMKYGTGLHKFAAAHRERFFDVGIAEEHAVTFAGGLQSQGMLPVFCVYSSFLQRAYDQILHDLAIDSKKVLICVDRAGLVGEDGETHQGMFDVAFLSHIPGVTIYSPEGYEETDLCVRHAIKSIDGVCAVRYPRGGDKRVHTLSPSMSFHYLAQGGSILLISYGRMFSYCWKAARTLEKEEHNVSLLKLTQIAPIPSGAISVAMRYKKIVFVEEGICKGGIAEQLGALLLEQGYIGEYHIQAIKNQFVPQGVVDILFERLGFDPESLVRLIKGIAAKQSEDKLV